MSAKNAPGRRTIGLAIEDAIAPFTAERAVWMSSTRRAMAPKWALEAAYWIWIPLDSLVRNEPFQ
jgi:hypothetical protein